VAITGILPIFGDGRIEVDFVVVQAIVIRCPIAKQQVDEVVDDIIPDVRLGQGDRGPV